MREISSRSAFKAVAVALVLAGASILTACGPRLDCATAKQRFADAPVKNISATDAERAVFCLTNDYRVANGRSAFTASTLLDGTARRHAQDAVTRKWWGPGADPHVNPDGKTPADRIRAAGYCRNGTSWQVAENVYWGWGTPLQTPRAAVNWWIGSSLHRANILDPNLRELGVGVALGAPQVGNFPDAAVFVQNFGRCS